MQSRKMKCAIFQNVHIHLNYRVFTLALVILLCVTTFYDFEFSSTINLFDITRSPGYITIISPQHSNQTLWIISDTNHTSSIATHFEHAANATSTNGDPNGWESSYKKPIHKLYPLKQFEYYKKWYSQFNAFATLNINKTYNGNVFNPCPAIPKQKTRLSQLYNISTKKIQYQSQPQLNHFLRDTSKTLDDRLSLKKLSKLKRKTAGIICDFNGKVFGIGMFKTGTTTLRNALHKLDYFGYYTEHFWVPNNWYRNIFDIYRFSSDDISWMFYQSDVIKRILAHSDISYSFSDAPWLFLYHLFDQYYSVPPKPDSQLQPNEFEEFEKIYGNLTNMDNGAKFVLTIRNSTWDAVNSVVKMKMRSPHGINKGNATS